MLEENDKSPLEESQEIIEEMAEGLYAPCKCSSGIRFPQAYATLQIDMTLLGEEEREKIYKAENLLHEVGIHFDTGSGCGCRDWKLDWSLGGAFLKVHRINCANYHRHKEQVFPSHIYWATLERTEDKYIVSHAYCSQECRDDGIKRREGYKLIWLAETAAEIK